MKKWDCAYKKGEKHPHLKYEKAVIARRIGTGSGGTGDLFPEKRKKRGARMTGKSRENYNKNYISYVKSFDPPTKHFKTCGRAFLVGGAICCLGQFFRNLLELAGLSGDILAGTVSIILIFLGTLLTGLGVYDRIGKNAGAGSIVPITGFANSVASPAIEFKTEGFVYGMAAKMFIVAGPIVVFGVTAGAAVGIIYWLLG